MTMILPSQSVDDGADGSKDRLRRILNGLARARTLVTYKDLAARLGLMPPQTIRQLTSLLEDLMAEDAAAGRPLLAALCVGRLRHGLPAAGFFLTAEELGLFAGAPEGPEACDFHACELARLFGSDRPSCGERDFPVGCDGKEDDE